jgi:hypothetical protein
MENKKMAKQKTREIDVDMIVKDALRKKNKK